MTSSPAPRASRFARAYTRLAPVMDARGAAEHRRELVAGLTGMVAEVGCGPGSMFAHYPDTVTRVFAIEPDPYLRDAARRAADGSMTAVTVLAARAEALPLAPGSVDAVVFSLVLCSVPDPSVALAEAARVLRPGGEVRFYEHVRSASRGVALLEDIVTPLWRRLAGGCHPNRDTPALIRDAGFTVEDVRRFGFAPAPAAPRIAHVVGVARRDAE